MEGLRFKGSGLRFRILTLRAYSLGLSRHLRVSRN